MLEAAIEQKMKDQAAFVAWWDEEDRAMSAEKLVSDRKLISADEAEKLSGITKNQVKKWRCRLKEPVKK